MKSLRLVLLTGLALLAGACPIAVGTASAMEAGGVGTSNPWGGLADIEFRRQPCGALRAADGLPNMPGENLYDPRTGKGLTRNPALDAYRPVHIGDALIGLEAGFVNGIWQSMAAPTVDGMLKSKGLTNLNPAQQAIADRFLNPVQIDQSSPVQRGFSISGTGAAMAGMAIGGVRTSGLGATGQAHHAISKPIYRALQQHPKLQGLYRYRDPAFVLRAKDLAAHRGYQRWHRELDQEIVEDLRRNPQWRQPEFEDYLRNRYDKPDLKHRFPGGFGGH